MQETHSQKLQQLGGEIQSIDNQMVTKLKQVVGEFGGTGQKNMSLETV